MNGSLRRYWVLFLLAGMLVVVGGSASVSGAASCSGLGSFAFSFPTPPTPFAAEVGTKFTVTVTAKDTCGETLKNYKGPATLSGNLTGATYGALTWVSGTGTGTGDVTPAKSEAFRTLTVTDTKSGIASTSATFEVYDDLALCDAVNGCSASEDNGTTGVTVNIPGKPELVGAALGVSLSDLHQKILCTRLDGSTIGGTGESDPATIGSLHTIAPPAAAGDVVAVVRYSKAEAPGTGVANFVHCKNTGPGTPFTQLGTCAKKNPEPGCILDQRRNGVGDLVVTFLLDSLDPVGGTFG